MPKELGQKRSNEKDKIYSPSREVENFNLFQ